MEILGIKNIVKAQDDAKVPQLIGVGLMLFTHVEKTFMDTV